jgi:hypothetical protein
MVFAADGSLLVASGDTVWRYGPSRGRTLIAGMPGANRDAGDGGPAIDARFGCASGLDVDPAGSVLVADTCARRVRRITPDGVIATVAGSGARGSGGDGGPALQASLRAPQDVVALPGGDFAVLDARGRSWTPDLIRRVSAEGTIGAWATVPVAGAIAEQDGSLLLVNYEHDPSGALVWRLDAQGTVEPMIYENDHGNVGRYAFCIGVCEPNTGSIARTADGGFLFPIDFTVQYVAPEPPVAQPMLAVGVSPSTRIPRPALQVGIRLTRAATVRVEVWGRDNELVGAREVELPAGESVLPFPDLARAAIYSIRAVARDAQHVVSVYAEAFAGGITTSFAKTYIVWSELPYGRRGDKLTCRRSGWRADCGIVRRRRCAAVVRVEINQTGTAEHSVYSGGRGRRCRLQLDR